VVSEGYAADDQDILVTKLLGQKVYSSIADSAREIGTINNMVVTSGMGISAVVIGVGGFLGVGEKDIAVDFAELTWAKREDGSRRWVLEITQEELADAPRLHLADSEGIHRQARPHHPAGTEPAGGWQSQRHPARPLPHHRPARTPGDHHHARPLRHDQCQPGPISVPTNCAAFPVYGPRRRANRHISDVVLTPQGNSDALIVDVGGFLGLGAKTRGRRLRKPHLLVRHQWPALPVPQHLARTARSPAGIRPATYETERNSQRMVVTP
jgi:hypothetical protein